MIKVTGSREKCNIAFMRISPFPQTWCNNDTLQLGKKKKKTKNRRKTEVILHRQRALGKWDSRPDDRFIDEHVYPPPFSHMWDELCDGHDMWVTLDCMDLLGSNQGPLSPSVIETSGRKFVDSCQRWVFYYGLKSMEFRTGVPKIFNR